MLLILICPLFHNIKGNKAISMMRRKSLPSELIFDIIRSNNSFIFLKRICKGRHFYTFILIKRAKLNKISLFISITLKYAIFTHHWNWRMKVYNEIHVYKSFARIHNLKCCRDSKINTRRVWIIICIFKLINVIFFTK